MFYWRILMRVSELTLILHNLFQVKEEEGVYSNEFYKVSMPSVLKLGKDSRKKKTIDHYSSWVEIQNFLTKYWQAEFSNIRITHHDQM